MRKQIEQWKNSKKYAEFQEKMQDKKNDLLKLKVKIMNEENEYYDDGKGFSREKLISILALIKEIDQEEEMNEDEFDSNYFSVIGNFEEILIEYLQKQYMWFRYLYDYLIIEEFEIAAEIRDVILIEEKQVIKLILRYRLDIIETYDDYQEKIESINVELYEKLNKELDERNDKK